MSFKQLDLALQPFIDPGGAVYIIVDVEGQDKPDVLPLESKQGRAVIQSRLCDFIKRGFPTDHETRTAFGVLHGCAYERKRRVARTSVDHLIGQKPLAQAVVIISQKGGTQKTPRHLLAAVNSVALANGIDIKTGQWPSSEDALGKQLSTLIDLLKRKGVVVEFSRSGERLWSIHAYSAASDESVEQVTSVTAEPWPDSDGVDTSAPGRVPANRLPVAPVGDIPEDELNTLLNGAVK